MTEAQERILEMLVDAARNSSRDDRRPFRVTAKPQPNSPFYEVYHRAIAKNKMRIYRVDLDELERQKLIRYTSEHRTQFDITSDGYEKYQELKERAGNPLEEAESSMQNYLNDALFKGRFPKAYEKWSRAAHAMASPEADTFLTQIGHDCREAMQEFTTDLVEEFRPPHADVDKAHTVSRIQAVVKLRKVELGETKHAFLDALIAYWGTVSDLVQRQEHGANKEGKALIWEDSRRVVFHTGAVMYELDRGLR